MKKKCCIYCGYLNNNDRSICKKCNAFCGIIKYDFVYDYEFIELNKKKIKTLKNKVTKRTMKKIRDD